MPATNDNENDDDEWIKEERKKKQTHQICSTITHRFGRKSENATFICIDLNIRCTVYIYCFLLIAKQLMYLIHDMKQIGKRKMLPLTVLLSTTQMDTLKTDASDCVTGKFDSGGFKLSFDALTILMDPIESYHMNMKYQYNL